MIIPPRELSYENGKMDGRAEVLEAANNAYSDMVERYEEKIRRALFMLKMYDLSNEKRVAEIIQILEEK